ncbi:acyl-CoA dehydrogenase [Chromohalobacter sp. TMW 2.2308]|uniref:acyl-CoA dehydrogenase n=1 Tax=Chromohalobacter TaxID=42054 RepID=UPI001FFC6B29|nr:MULTISPECIES: acyl-CoA dehydrogenase [Chromohalobacter]MCK2042821.1 acyl-CoA dehydrogenase [Chromohalobacter moromii]MCT8514659.1 acyl-CoA dehydrogenase [Chromohalobacter sp. TMW 2.2271]
MSSYAAPLRDLRFVLEELLENRSLQLPEYQELTEDLITAILDEAARLAGEVWAPLNRRGDEQGCRLVEGEVRTPAGFAEAYRAFVEGGWNGIGSDSVHGGQGLPEVVASAVQEMWQAANMALALCPLLTAGAVEALAQHGSEALKARYLEKLVSGEWTGTMNLTEPQAGSDLSQVRTRAIPEGEHYRISGQKIFITWGEHDCADNIIHLVLARLPDAAEGNRGISLFLVPKFRVDEQGRLGERNDVNCVSLEHKLGIHGSPTCVLSFGEHEGAIGYLVGEPGRGLQHMFTMMNAARHKVGIQGIGVAERAYQQARAYAAERVQGYTPEARGGRSAVLSEHYDVRRMLLSMRARLEALRALALLSASEMDRVRHASTADERQRAQQRVDLYTPVVKAFSTDQAVDITSLGIQVHGGMGYIEETGAAQHLRDARIAPIYEGTNGIQALDLAGRKIYRDGGTALSGVLDEVAACADALTADTELAELGVSLHQGVVDLRRAVAIVLARGDDAERGPDALQALATPLLALTGHVLCAWQMGRAALIAQAALVTGDDDAFYRAKLASADFVLRQWLPIGRAQLAAIEADPGAFDEAW